MSKTREIIRFEVLRSLKKPSFWIAAILIPIGFGLYMAFAGLVGYNASETLSSGTDTTDKKLGIYDEAEYLNETKFVNADQKEQELEKIKDKESGISAVKEKKLDVVVDSEKEQPTALMGCVDVTDDVIAKLQ